VLSLLLAVLGVILIAQEAFFKVEKIFPLVNRHVHAPPFWSFQMKTFLLAGSREVVKGKLMMWP